jgi:hypothetical protein
MPGDKLTWPRAAPDRPSGDLAPIVWLAELRAKVSARVSWTAYRRRNARGDHRRVTPGPDPRFGLTLGEQSLGRALNKHRRSRASCSG